MAELETTIDSIRVSIASPERIIILKEKEAENYLLIWVSSSQADILAAELQGRPDRNIATKLFLSNINATDSKIKSATIHLENHTFYAKLLLSQHDKSFEVKCPIGVALTAGFSTGVPILVDEALFGKVGVTLPPYSVSITPKESWWSRLFK